MMLLRLGPATEAGTDERLVRNNGGISEPEFRLPPTIAYVPALPHSTARCARIFREA
jgi:hypothetical protein